MILALLLVLINIRIFMAMKKAQPAKAIKAKSSDGEWTVYGSMGCGWTRKQLEYMEKNGKPFKFVDCEKEGCSGMEAFPTIVHPNGEKTVGYSEI